MRGIQLSALQWRRIRSTFNAHSVRESVVSAAKVIRRNAVRLAWITVTFAPMVMLYNASRADGCAARANAWAAVASTAPSQGRFRVRIYRPALSAPPRHAVMRPGRG